MVKKAASDIQKNVSLTPAEWHLMECLWEQVPRTSREVVDYLKADMGWSKSTTLTMLRRMTEKGCCIGIIPWCGLQSM